MGQLLDLGTFSSKTDQSSPFFCVLVLLATKNRSRTRRRIAVHEMRAQMCWIRSPLLEVIRKLFRHQI